MRGDGCVSIAISSGHSTYVAGATGLVKEVEQARKIVDRIEVLLRGTMPVTKFHDNVSRTQTENIQRIVTFHNAANRQCDYSIHLNSSSVTTNDALGVEVLYYDEPNRQHAFQLATAISEATGLKNRGAKKRPDIGFLRDTHKPAFLIEAYFVNSRADVTAMDEEHEVHAFALAVAKTVAMHQQIVYQASDAQPYRVKSGAFQTKAAAERAVQQLIQHRIASAKYTKVYQDGNVWRFQTGSYANEQSAHDAIRQMKTFHIVSVAYRIRA